MSAPDLVFFGASLTDDSTLFDVTEGLVKDGARQEFGGDTGAISDGATFAVYAGEALGGEVENYAVAGAQAAGSRTLGDLAADTLPETALLVPADDAALAYDINLGAQVDRFVADQAGADLAQSAAFILIGANDYSVLEEAPAEAMPSRIEVRDEAVGATLAAAEELSEAGMGQVTILTLPGPEYFANFYERAPAEQEKALAAYDNHNALLIEGAAALAAEGHSVEVLDIDPITSAIGDAPDAYGFVAPYTLTIKDDDALAQWDDEQVAFWDDTHASTANHAILGSFVAAVSEGAAVVDGGDGDEALQGGAGVDIMLGNGGADTLSGRGGDDVINGHDGDDLLLGEAGDDLLSGGAGNDRASGGEGADTLAGHSGDDLLAGKEGDDVLIGGLGNDRLIGGDGDDVFVHIEAGLLGGTQDGLDRYVGGTGNDTLYLVLSEESYAEFRGRVDLPGLGVTGGSIENLVVLEGLDALDELEDAPWSAEADMWGLI